MIKRFLFFLLGFLFLQCQVGETTSDIRLSLVPRDALVILKTSDFNGFIQQFDKNRFLETLDSLNFAKSLTAWLQPLEEISLKNEVLFSVNKLGRKRYELSLVSSLNLESQLRQREETKIGTSFAYERVQITPFSHKADTIYSAFIQKNNILSTSRLLIENVIRHHTSEISEPGLLKTFKAFANDDRTVLFVNLKKAPRLFNNLYAPGALKYMRSIASWTALAINIDERELGLDGIGLADNEEGELLSLFKQTRPLKNEFAQICPSNTLKLASFTFDNYEIFKSNKANLLEKTVAKKMAGDTTFAKVSEIGFATTTEGKLAGIRSNYTYNVKKLLEPYEQLDDVENELQIINTNNPGLLEVFYPLIDTLFRPRFCTKVNDFYIFSEKKAVLKGLLENFKTGDILTSGKIWENTASGLTQASSALIYSAPNHFKEFVSARALTDFKDEIKALDNSRQSVAFQVSADKSFYHLNLQLTENEIMADELKPDAVLDFELDAPGLREPQWVLNHKTNEYEIAVQDELFKLYLFSKNGGRLWTRQLESAIKGKIKQVDLYRNNRLQMAFTTLNRFWILDRNGKAVAPFSFKYNEEVLPLAVFDYDNNKDYRLVVCAGKNVYMYNRQGKIVGGFGFTEAKDKLKVPPVHIRHKKNDYLVFADSKGQFYILSRRGRIRVPVNQKFRFSDNNIYWYNNSFAFTEANGNLININIGGDIKKTDLLLEPGHKIDASTKSMVTLNKNILTIKGNEVLLEEGTYAEPKLFYFNDTLYFAVTNLDSGLVYVYYSSGKLLEGFPIEGYSATDIIYSKKTGALEIAVLSEENIVKYYSLPQKSN